MIRDCKPGDVLRSNDGAGPLLAEVAQVFSDGSVLLRRWDSKAAKKRRHKTPFSLTLRFLRSPRCGWVLKSGRKP